MYTRLCNPLKERSFFLFGARGTGKSHLLRHIFRDAPSLWVDLLRDEEVLELTRYPTTLESRIRKIIRSSSSHVWVVLDEVQRVPSLLNEVHRILEVPDYQGKVKFALTGSSARKLKRGGGNLLAGRALLNYLFPLTYRELGDQFLIDQVMTWGTLPSVMNSTSDLERADVLRAYFSTYLKEEIKEEQLIRKLDPFLRFLETAAHVNGELLNFARIGRDCLVDEKQVVRYFQILEDTLIGFFLLPFHESIRKRQTAQPKFYFFDVGVHRSLLGMLNSKLVQGSSEYGRTFEHLVILEFLRLNFYLRKDFRFSYFRTSDGFEIDLVVERPGKKRALVEIKSATSPDPVEVSKLAASVPVIRNAEAYILCQARAPSDEGGVKIMPWQLGIDEIFNT